MSQLRFATRLYTVVRTGKGNAIESAPGSYYFANFVALDLVRLSCALSPVSALGPYAGILFRRENRGNLLVLRPFLATEEER